MKLHFPHAGVPVRDRPEMPIDIMTGRNCRSLPEARRSGQIRLARPDTAVESLYGPRSTVQPAFGEIRKIIGKVLTWRKSSSWLADDLANQNGLITAIMTIPTMSPAGTSLIMR